MADLAVRQTAPQPTFDIKVDHADGSDEMTIRATGTHKFALRSDNLEVAGPSLHASSAEWRCKIIEGQSPWVAVIIPDDSLAERRELTGVK